MPHSPEDKKRAVARLRRIKGQAEALERAVLLDTPCHVLLQQIAALRGAANGLMAEMLQSHLTETFAQAPDHNAKADATVAVAEIDQIMRVIRTYLR